LGEELQTNSDSLEPPENMGAKIKIFAPRCQRRCNSHLDRAEIWRLCRLST
jgi:hypothetical protein